MLNNVFLILKTQVYLYSLHNMFWYFLHQIKANADESHKLQRMIYLAQNLIIREEMGG